MDVYFRTTSCRHNSKFQCYSCVLKGEKLENASPVIKLNKTEKKRSAAASSNELLSVHSKYPKKRFVAEDSVTLNANSVERFVCFFLNKKFLTKYFFAFFENISLKTLFSSEMASNAANINNSDERARFFEFCNQSLGGLKNGDQKKLTFEQDDANMNNLKIHVVLTRVNWASIFARRKSELIKYLQGFIFLFQIILYFNA